ncbi:unnamed protein product [Notodromas monacha]|uniref:Uncharacterized protein n=1 Tax=Notodromas monacha TaxID=399045 RepID=A0A7R9GIP4_9CRUS|nr:unnamed protein product [Notodromas monacha]CAG0922009.1 unnamed protein product [Notodromas monacha]
MSRKEVRSGDSTGSRKFLPRIRRALFQNDDSEDDAELTGNTSFKKKSHHGKRLNPKVDQAAEDEAEESDIIPALLSTSTDVDVHSNPLYEKIVKKGRVIVEEPRHSPEQAIPVISVSSPGKEGSSHLVAAEVSEPHYANLKLKSKPVPVDRGTLGGGGGGALKLNELDSDNRALRDQLKNLAICGSDQIQSIVEEKNCLAERVKMLEDLSFRLNLELGALREALKRQNLDPGSGVDFPTLAFQLRQGTPRWLSDLPATLALLDSYDDKLKSSMRNEETKDWESIKAEAVKVLSTNEDLQNRLARMENDARVAHSEHLCKVEELSIKLERSELAKKQLELEISGLQAQYRIVREQYFTSRLEQEKCVPIVEHEAAVSQCYKLFGEAKKKYEKEQKQRVKQMEELTKDVAGFKAKLKSKDEEARHAVDELEKCKRHLKDCKQQLAFADTRSVDLEEEKRVVERKLQELLASCENSACVKARLEALVAELRVQNSSLLKQSQHFPKKLNRLKSKLKTVEFVADRKISEMMKELERYQALYKSEAYKENL